MSDQRKSNQPLDAKQANPSLNSEIRAATANQGQVRPEDYPAAEREGQTAVVQAPAEAVKNTRKAQ